jgi:hypothetical protein
VSLQVALAVFLLAVAALAFWVGYGIGRDWHRPIDIIIHQPAPAPKDRP